MATIKQIQFKRTTNPGVKPTPAQLAEGELAINLADRTLYTKDHTNVIIDLGFAKGGTVTGDINQTGNFNLSGDMSAWEITANYLKARESIIGFKTATFGGETENTAGAINLANHSGGDSPWNIISYGGVSESGADSNILIFRNNNKPYAFAPYSDVIRLIVDKATGTPSLSVLGSADITNDINFRNNDTGIQWRASTDSASIKLHVDAGGIGTLIYDIGDDVSDFHRFSHNGHAIFDLYESFVKSYKDVYLPRIVHEKPLGEYDSVSLPTTTDNAANRLRQARAKNGSTIFHELVNNETSDPKTRYSVSWYNGNGPDTWMGGINQAGDIQAARSLIAHGGNNAIQLNGAANSPCYIGGNIDGAKDSWILGKTGAGQTVSLNSYLGGYTAVNLDPGIISHQVGTNTIARFFDNRLVLDGARWAATNKHSWADQWNQQPPVLINMGAVPGGSDYYPGYAIENISAGVGYPTRFELGMIRAGTDWGQGILRIASYSEDISKAQMATFSFKMSGEFSAGSVRAPKGITLSNERSTLGAGSIALGDSDTGIQWGGDGWYKFVANGNHIATIDSAAFYSVDGKTISSNGDLIQANDSFSTYVRDIFIRSDIRVKSELRKFESPSEISKKLNGYLYLQKKGFKEDGSINWEQSSGLIAQEVQDVLPELISVDKDSPEGLLRLNYNGIVALNTATINEHTDEISELKARIQKLEEIVSTLI